MESNLMGSKDLALHGNEAVEAVGRPQRKLIVCKSALHLGQLDPTQFWTLGLGLD